MAELEIHHEGAEEKHDPMGQRVGIMAAVLAVLLAIVTIASHRTHTDAIIARSEANDKWQQYQSTRVKFHSLELGEDLVSTLAPSHAEAQALRYDIGEGLLEIALVLSSLYFIAHKSLFPGVGGVAGLAGIAIAITGYLK